MQTALDGVIVQTECPTCGARIGAPYVQVRNLGIFACGCGTVVDAVMSSVAVQAIIGLAEADERRTASVR